MLATIARGGTGADRLELQAEVVDELRGSRTPLRRGIDETSERLRLGHDQRFDASLVLERLPVGQARADRLHVLRVPPAFVNLNDGSEVDSLAGVDNIVQKLPPSGLPGAEDVQVAGLDRGERGDVVRGYVLDVVTHALKNAAEDGKDEVGVRKIEIRDLDWIDRFRNALRVGLRYRHAEREQSGETDSRKTRGAISFLVHTLVPLIL